VFWLTNFLYLFKNKIIYNFTIFVASKNRTKKFSPSSFGAVVGSGIRDPGWIEIRIRDKHPGSATLVVRFHIVTLPLLMGRELCWRCFILRACVCSVHFLFEDVLVEYRVPLRLDLPVSLVHEAIFSHSVLPLTQVAYFVNLSQFRKHCCGSDSGSTGSTCFWAFRIRIH
jgi:hypothetical protein